MDPVVKPRDDNKKINTFISN
ncbi:MAG: hypothetical protein LN546_06950 [Rickettsia endosymbiont of Ecitomorpha arachnoides]|nr:hypothetical protein [Rickettsia endosymbiont of Sceptobius lativentris]MCC8462857.1 hypothetical protein [Rickettsia endosymbiont of Ecitomorpha arachnoides]